MSSYARRFYQRRGLPSSNNVGIHRDEAGNSSAADRPCCDRRRLLHSLELVGPSSARVTSGKSTLDDDDDDEARHERDDDPAPFDKHSGQKFSDDKGEQPKATMSTASSSTEARYTSFADASESTTHSSGLRRIHSDDVPDIVLSRVQRTSRLNTTGKDEEDGREGQHTAEDYLELLTESLTGDTGDGVDVDATSEYDDDDDGDARNPSLGQTLSGWSKKLWQDGSIDAPLNGIMLMFDLFFDCIEPPRENGYNLSSPASSTLGEGDTSADVDVDSRPVLSTNATTRIDDGGDDDGRGKEARTTTKPDGIERFSSPRAEKDGYAPATTNIRRRGPAPRGWWTSHNSPKTSRNEPNEDSKPYATTSSRNERRRRPDAATTKADPGGVAYNTHCPMVKPELERKDSAGGCSDDSLSIFLDGFILDPSLNENDDLTCDLVSMGAYAETWAQKHPPKKPEL